MRSLSGFPRATGKSKNVQGQGPLHQDKTENGQRQTPQTRIQPTSARGGE